MAATKHAVDFTNVKEGGNFSKKHMPVGDYLARITKVEDAKPKDKDDHSDMWLFTVQLEKTKSATYPYYCKLVENQLWKIRNLCVAAGINVPKKRINVDPNKLVGKLIGVSLDDAEYEGKVQSEIGAVLSPSDIEGSSNVNIDADDDDEDLVEPDDEDEADEEEEAPAPKKAKKKAKPAPAPEPEPAKKKKAKKSKDEDDDEIDIEDL